MNTVKTILSYILYWIGDMISKLLVWDLFAFLYPVYNKLMICSSNLDIHNKLWRKSDEHEDYTNKTI